MSRLDLAYLMLFLMIALGATIWYLSHRFARYQHDVRHGKRDARPVWRPFWMN